jgi:excisionase family DNA binding protein
MDYRSQSIHNIPGTEILSRDELAARLLKHPGTIQRWVREGRIPTLRVGRSLLFNFPDVMKVLRNNSN